MAPRAAPQITHHAYHGVVPTTFFDPMMQEEDLACTYLDDLLDEAKDGLFVAPNQIAPPAPALAAKQPNGLPDGQVPTMLRQHRASGVQAVMHVLPTSSAFAAQHPALHRDTQAPTYLAGLAAALSMPCPSMPCPPPHMTPLVPDVTHHTRPAPDGFAVPTVILGGGLPRQEPYASTLLESSVQQATEQDQAVVRKRQERLHRNRKSAQHSRERKKQLMQTLQQRNVQLEEQLGQMGAKVACLERQNQVWLLWVDGTRVGGCCIRGRHPSCVVNTLDPSAAVISCSYGGSYVMVVPCLKPHTHRHCGGSLPTDNPMVKPMVKPHSSRTCAVVVQKPPRPP